MSHNLNERYQDAMHGKPGAEDRFFEALVERAWQLLTWHARRRSVTRDDVLQDLLQEVLIHLLEDIRKRPGWFSHIENWDALISKQIWWRINDYFRSLKKDRKLSTEPFEDERMPVDNAPSTVVEYMAWVIDENVSNALDKRWRLIESCMVIAGVSDTTCNVVRLRLQGHSFEEIANTTGLSVNAATLRYHAFCKTFRAFLKAQNEGADV